MTLRLRLTLLYGACFLVAGAVLLAITYGLVEHSLPAQQAIVLRGFTGPLPSASGGIDPPDKGNFFLRNTSTRPSTQSVPPPFVRTALRNAAKRIQHAAQVDVTVARQSQQSALLTESGVALVIMAFVSIALGWIVAGRALRPLRTMSARARQITEHNLHERLAVDSRNDELGELAQTFDGLLGRLQRAFESQRRFVANASQELRTPVTLERALIEVAISDPEASVESLRECCQRVLAAGEQQERLIEALLTLARGQAGIEARDRVDLGAVVEDLVEQRDPAHDAVELRVTIEPAVIQGDRALIERLVANLLDNAVAYNLARGGWVQIDTGVVSGRPDLRVSNSGSRVPAERVMELFEPFRRLDGERINGDHGIGLGLSIVSAIATAHHAQLDASAPPEGGLLVELSFPPVS
jgi:signal transduction histidine kinase